METDSVLQALLASNDTLVYLSFAALTFAVGLDAPPDKLLFVLRRPRLLIAGIASVNVVVPVFAGALIALLPLSFAAKAAIMLMVISPVPPTLPSTERELGATRSYAYGLYAALIAVAVIYVPAAVMAAGWIYGVAASIPAAEFASSVGLEVVIPLLLGMGVRRFFPAFAVAAPWLVRGSLVLLFAGELPVLLSMWPVMLELVGNGTIAAMMLVVFAGLVSGHVLGGADHAHRASLAHASANRHPGIATMIASANAGDERVLAAILLFLITGVVMTLLYNKTRERWSHAGH
jgi:BASS family bile acid:Na+ symporter